MESGRVQLAELILPESVRDTSTEGNGSGWSLTYDCFLCSSGVETTPNWVGDGDGDGDGNGESNGFLIRLQNFHVLDPLYMPPGSLLVLDSNFQILHFPPAHFSSFSAVQGFVLTTLDRVGAPTTDPDPLARLLFSFLRRHDHTAATALVPFYISFTITTVLRNVDEAVDWLHGGTPESQIVRTLRSTYDAISKLKSNASFVPSHEFESSCMVCLEGFEDGRLVTRLPCSHEYHFKCVSRWLRFDHRCPVCRFTMPWVQTFLRNSTNVPDNPNTDHPQLQEITVAPAAAASGVFTRLGLFFKQLFTKLYSTYLLK